MYEDQTFPKEVYNHIRDITSRSGFSGVRPELAHCNNRVAHITVPFGCGPLTVLGLLQLDNQS
jgi:hypothetical protein